MTDVRPLPGTTLPVSEVFGPVWQGEGPHTGQLCSFLRLGLCNLSCSWCDTPYTWDHTRFDVHAECPDRTPSWILQQLAQHNTHLLVLSGGEPLVHQRSEALHALLSNLTGIKVHVETNGTLIPTDRMLAAVAHWTVSPKLAHGGDPAKRRLRPDALRVFARLARSGGCAWKLVVQSPEDCYTAVELADEFEVPRSALWLMPEGVTADAVLAGARELAGTVLEVGANLTLRQHTLLYGTERGR